MKILVLTCSTGGGHNSCANYIKNEFEDFGISCDVLDYMQIVGNKASHIAEKLYLDSTKGKGNIFKNVYKLGELYNKTGMTSPVYSANKLVREKLYNYLKENEYDLAIGTHVFPCLALTALKKDHDFKFINVATDYECIPFWNETNPDLFVIPSELLKYRFVEKGIDSKILLPIGIPVSSKFINETNEVMISKDKKMVLLTSGSMGFGEIEKIVKAILDKVDCHLVVVCGNNKKMKLELDKITDDKLMVLGFINNLNDYIKASSIVITKPGGLTTTEVAMMRKPLIHMMPIPGVETYNAEFFAKNNMSISAKTIDEVVDSVIKLLGNKDMREEMISSQKKLINDKSAKDLVEYVIKNFN